MEDHLLTLDRSNTTIYNLQIINEQNKKIKTMHDNTI